MKYCRVTKLKGQKQVLNMDMQVKYPKKLNRPVWDLVHVRYPVRKYPTTGVSSETMGRLWRPQPEVLKNMVGNRNELLITRGSERCFVPSTGTRVILLIARAMTVEMELTS